MQPEITDTFDIILKWQHLEPYCTFPDISLLRFSPFSISEFEIIGEIQLWGGLNYQGPTRINFTTRCYAYEMQHFAKNLRELRTVTYPQPLFICGHDLELTAVKSNKPEAIVTELCYRPFRRFGDAVFDTELRVHLGPFTDPLGSAKAIAEVISTLQMDCRIDPDHSPIELPRK